MRGNRSRVELEDEAEELSEGMLGIIGAYGMAAGAEVRVVPLKAASPPPERVLVPADARVAAYAAAATG
jgi:hypothetical protein